MTLYYLKTPVSGEEVRKLHIGDIVYLSGMIVTFRDSTHARALEILRSGGKPPVNLEGLAIYHAGPIMVKKEKTWVPVSVGPTTSMRMEPYEYEFIEKTGVRLIIGKGGMGSKTAEACRKFSAAYLLFPGGAAVLSAKAIRKTLNVYWLDLGMAEAMWVYEVKNMGPLLVGIDVQGNNMYDEILSDVRKRLKQKILKEALEEIAEFYRRNSIIFRKRTP